MFCEHCKSAMVTRLSEALVKAKFPHKKKLGTMPAYKLTSTCVKCGHVEMTGLVSRDHFSQNDHHGLTERLENTVSISYRKDP